MFDRCNCRTDGYVIFPVVYVRETDTVIPETGCGSGSVALALSMTDGNGSCSVFQPSGCPYQLDVSRETKRTMVTLGSDVDVLVKGVAYIAEPKSEELLSPSSL